MNSDKTFSGCRHTSASMGYMLKQEIKDEKGVSTNVQSNICLPVIDMTPSRG